MQKNGLRPRAIGALSVVAASLFLLLCLANYGQGGFETAGDAPLHLAFAGWFVEVFGAGAFALVLLPLVWGLVVYFREDTPALSMRAAGTLLLACSISMISGLVQGTPEVTWAGAVGEYTVALTLGLGGVVGDGFAMALAWGAAVTLFMASLVWATDWWFHSLRKGSVVPRLPAAPRLAVEPATVELREDDEETTEREFVAMQTAGSAAASTLSTEPAQVDEPLPVEEVPEGFSVRESGDRMLVRGPAGYEGVEFLPPSDELAPPEPPEERFLHDDALPTEQRFVDEEFAVTNQDAESDDAGDILEQGAPDGADASPADDVVPPIASVEETLGHDASPFTAAPRWTEATAIPEDADAAPALESTTTAPPPVEPAVNAHEGTAHEGTAHEEPTIEDEIVADERPRSGIGIPDDSPFVDEFFSVDVLVADGVATGGDGASADGEIEAAFGTTIPSEPSAERSQRVAETQAASPAAQSSVAHSPDAHSRDAHAPAPEPTTASGEPVIVDELLFADAYTLIDDEIPAPIAARSAAPPAHSDADALAATSPGLERIHDMQLDPLFHDAVEVVLEAERGSAMTLQRRFGIGHGRGLRLLQQMEEAGVLAAEDDAGTRPTLIDRAAWDAFTGTRTA